MAKKINNERTYSNYDIICYTANTNREYYITDTYQLEQDGGIVKQAVHQYSDLYPVPGTDKIISDADRLEMEKRAYARGVRMLKAQRPDKVFSFKTTALPADLCVGDKVRFIFSKVETSQDECGNLVENTLISVDDYFYVTKIQYDFDEALNEIDTITLDKELRTNDFSMPELELPDKEDDDDSSGSSDNTSSNSISYESGKVRTAIIK